MIRRTLLALALALAYACSCQSKPGSGDAVILAHVVLVDDPLGSCIRLEVRDTGVTAPRAESRLPRLAGKAEYFVAVYRVELPESVRLVAHLAVGDGCNDPLAANVRSEERDERFIFGEIRQVDLVLRKPPTSDDADGDGFVAAARGGPDCNDADPTVRPGAAEDCGSSVADRNCDGRIGCIDPTCNGQMCGPNATCCPGRCLVELCDDGTDNDCNGLVDCLDPICPAMATPPETNCQDGRDNDCNGSTDCQDATCANKTCGPNRLCDPAAKTCTKPCTVTQAPPETRCDDGLDNDCNGVADCSEVASCDSRRCDANGRVCQSGRCECPGTPPETTCGDGNDNDCDGASDCTDADCLGRTCQAGRNCSQLRTCVAVEVNCADGNDNDNDGRADCADADCDTRGCTDDDACTTGDRCQAGSCAPTGSMTCNTPGSCKAAPGNCVPATGTCVYPNATDGTSCSSNLCTRDTCQGGVCTPNAVVCNQPPGECYSATGACVTSDGGCAYPTRTGSCDGGAACATGTCSGGTCNVTTVTCDTPPNLLCYPATGSCVASDGGCTYTARPNGSCCGPDLACQGGSCTGAPSEVCTDNADNDCDSFRDCADDNCNGSNCSGSRSCCTGDTLCSDLRNDRTRCGSCEIQCLATCAPGNNKNCNCQNGKCECGQGVDCPFNQICIGGFCQCNPLDSAGTCPANHTCLIVGRCEPN